MRLGEAETTMDRDVLPVLVVYRAGEVLDTLFRLCAELGDKFSADDLEQHLDTSQAFLDPASQDPTAAHHAAFTQNTPVVAPCCQ